MIVVKEQVVTLFQPPSLILFPLFFLKEMDNLYCDTTHLFLTLTLTYSRNVSFL